MEIVVVVVGALQCVERFERQARVDEDRAAATLGEREQVWS